MQNKLIYLVQTRFNIPRGAINFALNQRERSSSHFHVILWQYQFLSNDQFYKICEWLDQHSLDSMHDITILETINLDESCAYQYPTLIRNRLNNLKKSEVGDWKHNQIFTQFGKNRRKTRQKLKGKRI